MAFSKPVIWPSYQMMPWPRSTTPMVLFLGFQQRSLFDVQFDEGAELPLRHRLVAAIADAVQRLAHGDARSVLARKNVVDGVIAGIGGPTPSSPAAKREPSSLVQLTMQIGVSVSIPASLRVRTTSSAASVPRMPSNLPPVGWVSRCEPRPTGGFVISRPLRRPNIEPSASTRTSRPAASQALRNQSRTCLSSGPSVSRRTPPSAWHRISQSREWCPRAGRNRSAGWRATFVMTGPIFRNRATAHFNDAPAAARQQ